MLEILDRYKSHKFAKYAIILLILILFYISYKFHIWVNTESTDNAYIGSNISSVSAEINGIVNNVLISNNMIVKIGDIIAEIDDTDYQARLAKIEASIKALIIDIQIIKQKI